MTTFTTEDREWAFWHNYNTPKYSRQVEIEFFFPLTEQIPLNLSFEGCDTKPKLTALSVENGGITWTTVSTTTISPQLTITPTNSVGEISIGGIRVGLEKKPTWLQRRLHKLLGFNWKDR